MASNTSDFFTFSKTAGTAKNLQKPTDGGDNNLWGGYINVDLDTIVGAVNATSDLIADANQNELVDFTATGSAVNHVGITNAATGNGPTIEAKGDDSNVDLNVKPKGTGAILLKDGDGNELVKTSRTASAVNEITVANAATGNGPTLSATGDDTNIDLNIAGKGTGEIEIASNIAFSNDTDAKIKLPSAGGIFESDGSTEILTESSGSVSLRNVNNVYQTTFLERTSGGLDVEGTQETSISSETFVNKKGGSTLYIEVFFQVQVGRKSGGAGDTGLRYADFRLYQNSSAVSQDATSGFGTEIARRIAGRQSDNSTTPQPSYVPVSIVAKCTTNGSANQNNLFSITCTGSGSITRTELFCSSTFPIIFKFTEIA